MTISNEDILIRLATMQDVDELWQLDQKSWSAHLAASKEVIVGRLERLPNWQYVLEKNKKVCGILYTQRVENLEQLLQGGFAFHTSRCTSDGPILQLVSIAVDQQIVPNGGVLLRNNIVSKVKEETSIKRLVALTRCSAFESHDEQTHESYMKYVFSIKDPTIFFHVSGGATILQVAAGYRPEDSANLGNAVLIEYEDIRRDKTRSLITSSSIILQISKVSSKNEKLNMNANSPILNVIDSQQLMLLHGWIETQVQETLQADFLFRYSTPAAIEKYFKGSIHHTAALPRDEIEIASSDDPIAIVGIGFRLPGKIETLPQLWDTMKNKECKSKKVPKERWSMFDYDKNELVDSAEKARAVDLGCFLDDVDLFDHEYFNMSLPEAQSLDPNHRIILESVAKAVHDSKRSIQDLNGKNIGVWVGLSNSDYHEVPGSSFEGNPSVYGATGGAASMAAGRVSFILGLNGPSSVLDTACSSSLVALHEACNALRLNECDEAIVAAANLILAPWVSLAYARAGMTSPDGKCLTFDETANGYCRGEGCGAVVLKQLSKVIPGTEQVYAVIRGSAVMHHGRGASLTAPNSLIQEQLIQKALRMAKVSSDMVDFVEAHGTGTRLGDPIEVAALANVFGTNQHLLVNSVKANIGHLEAAAGLAGLFSVLAEFKFRSVAPNANLNNLNSKIGALINGKNISFPTSIQTLNSRAKTHFAGISSFGYSGTIAHMIVESISSDVDDALPCGPSEEEKDRVIWQFTGQGNLTINSQRVFLKDSVFVDSMHQCDEELLKLVGIKMSITLYPDDFPSDGVKRDGKGIIEDILFSQLLLVCLDYCIAQSMFAKGMQPAALIGHSLGEYVAAVVGGALSLQACLQMVFKRGQLIRDCEQCAGHMYMIHASEMEVKKYIELSNCKNLGIAAVNGEALVVVSGPVCEIDNFLAGLDEKLRRIKLKMNRAYHSLLLQHVSQEYEAFLQNISTGKLSIPLISTVDGYEVIRNNDLSPSYWCDHMVRSVRFYDAIRFANNQYPTSKVIEIGPGPVLTNLCKRMSAADSSNLKFAGCGEILSNWKSTNYKLDGFYANYRQLKCPYFDSEKFYKPEALGEAVDLLRRFGKGLQDHLVDGKIVVPGAALLEMALEFAGSSQHSNSAVVHLKDFAIMQSFVVPEKNFEVHSINIAKLEFDSTDNKRCTIINASNENGNDIFCASCSIDTAGNIQLGDIIDSKSSLYGEVAIGNPEHLYEEYRFRGLEFGASYRIVQSLEIIDKEVMKVVIQPADCDAYGGHILSPTVIDAVIHSAGSLMFTDPAVAKDDLFVPFSVDDIIYRPPMNDGKQYHALIKLTQKGKDFCIFDCMLVNSSSNEVILQMCGLHMRKYTPSVPFGGLYADFLIHASPSWKVIDQIPVNLSDEAFKNKSVTMLLWSSNELDSSLVLKEYFTDREAVDVTIRKAENNLQVPSCDVLVWLVPKQSFDVEGRFLKDVLRILGAMSQPPERTIILSCLLDKDTPANSYFPALVSTIQLENFRCNVQSLTVGTNDLEADLLAGMSFCGANDSSLEILCKDGKLFERSFQAVETRSLSETNYELHLNARGSLSNFSVRVQKHQHPRPNEVIVATEAVSLNFRDVLNVLNMYPGDPGDPGCEFAGVVIGLGSDVTRFQVGDRVTGFAAGSLKERIAVSEDRICKVADNLALADAATLPVVFCTVELAVNQIMKLSASDVILIHTAAGGIGLAAIQYATQVGARIVATASDAKVEYLHNLGVTTVCSSRDSQLFREQMKEALGDGKVSCVLNTLNHDFILASLEFLGHGGTFVELGKRSVWSSEEMASYRSDVSYTLVEIDTMAEQSPATYIPLLESVNQKFANGQLVPLQKLTFDFLHGYSAAFNCLRTGSNIGKVVLTMKQAASNLVDDFPLVGKTIIITGGTGSLGVLTAIDVCEMGAKHVVLLSKSGKLSPNQSLKLEPFKEKISVIQCDVSEEVAVVSMLQEVRSRAGRVDGVIHAAGVLRDALIRGGGAAAGCAEVWNAKALSAWWLHEHTKEDQLSFFVCFSSIVSSIGREGQAAYGAANRFLDELCHLRIGQKMPSVAIQIPAIADIGMAADGKTALEDWSISSANFRSSLKTLLETVSSCSCSSVAIVPSTMKSMLHPKTFRTFREILVHEKPSIETIKNSTSKAKSTRMTVDELVESVHTLVTNFMGTGSHSITRDSNLVENGLDSLGATEFATKLGSEFGIKLPPTLVFNYPSIHAVVNRLKELLPALCSDQLVSAEIESNSETEMETLSDRSGAVFVERSRSEVGIIGLSMTLPGSIQHLATIHKKMNDKFVGTGEVSSDRWNLDDIFNSSEHLKRRKDYLKSLKYGGFLATQELDAFQGSDFGITDLEASKMDIRQKLVLKFAHKAMLDAKLDLAALKGKKVGVFVAALGQLTNSVKYSTASSNDKPSVFDATSNSLSVISGRISYIFGFEGPCISIDTACSSSLVAIHLAKKSIIDQESDLAIVVGVNLLDPELSVSFALAGMLSPDGRCHTFDEAANGYCRGEGCGAVVLKRLSDAQRDGDQIYAVVKGSAVMQDGKSASLTAPNGLAQEQLLRAALADAGVKAEEVSYIEAHGTGTKLGDPIEVEAIARVYGEHRSADNPLLVSGIKANIGHLEAAAGMAGLLASIAVLQRGAAPPNAQLQSLNRQVVKAVEGGGVEFPRGASMSLSAVARGEVVVGVSSFGYSGTIAHAILALSPKSVKPFPLQSICYPLPALNLPIGGMQPIREIQNSHHNSFRNSCAYVTRLHESLLSDYSMAISLPIPSEIFLSIAVAAILSFIDSSNEKNSWVAFKNIQISDASSLSDLRLSNPMRTEPVYALETTVSAGGDLTMCGSKYESPFMTAEWCFMAEKRMETEFTVNSLSNANLELCNHNGAVAAYTTISNVLVVELNSSCFDKSDYYVLPPRLLASMQNILQYFKIVGTASELKLNPVAVQNKIWSKCKTYLICNASRNSVQLVAVTGCIILEIILNHGQSIDVATGNYSVFQSQDKVVSHRVKPTVVSRNFRVVLEELQSCIAPSFSMVYSIHDHHRTVICINGSKYQKIEFMIQDFLKLLNNCQTVEVIVVCLGSDQLAANSIFGALLSFNLEKTILATCVHMSPEDLWNELLLEEVLNSALSAPTFYKVIDDGILMQQKECTVDLSDRKPSNLSGQSIVITGGLGGLGLLTAKTLVDLGASHIFLVSRSGRVAYADQGLEEDLLWLLEGQRTTAVHVLQCDVSEEAAVVSMLQEVRSRAGRVDGVIHAAGVLRDALIRGGGAAAGCAEVWNAKALSAWWLHEHTKQDALKYFVMYSSLTAAVGNVGQAAYGAANRFLDGLVEERRKAGMSGVSIRWPAVAGKGMAVNLKFQEKLLFAENNVCLVLKHILDRSSGVFTIVPKFALAEFPLLFQNFQLQTGKVDTSAAYKTSINLIANTLNDAAIEEKIKAAIKKHVFDSNLEDLNQSIFDIGVDSFGSVAVANEIAKALQIPFSVDVLYNSECVRDIITYVQKQMKNESSALLITEDFTGRLFTRLSTQDSPCMRMMIFPALGQPTVAWRKASTFFSSKLIDVSIMTLPGRYERNEQMPFQHVQEVVDTACQEIVELYQRAPSIPLIFLGHSFGTCIAYLVAKQLQTKHSIEVPHILSIAGISFDYLQTMPMYQSLHESLEAEEVSSLLLETSRIMFKEVPTYLDEKSGNFDQNAKQAAIQGMHHPPFCSLGKICTNALFFACSHNRHSIHSPNTSDVS
jgi:acyl transferase domain-containing protein/NADPH:quinone reductase-like Zn-dependent oxidoreductase/acyl carrier protein